MPDEEKSLEGEVAAPAVPPAKSKNKTIIMVVALVIVGLALAAGISLFVVTKMMGDIPGGASDEDGVGQRYHDPGVFVKLGDAKEGVLVNVGGPRSGKFLKASIIIEFNPGKKAVINEDTNTLYPDAEIKVNDVATQFLRGTSLEDFEPDKQEEFKKQLKDALNMALGNGSVYDIYITSFLLQ